MWDLFTPNKSIPAWFCFHDAFLQRRLDDKSLSYILMICKRMFIWNKGKFAPRYKHKPQPINLSSYDRYVVTNQMGHYTSTKQTVASWKTEKPLFILYVDLIYIWPKVFPMRQTYSTIVLQYVMSVFSCSLAKAIWLLVRAKKGLTKNCIDGPLDSPCNK